MRIVLLVHRFHPDIGGVETTAEVLARGWTERHGDQVTVITHTTESDPGVSFPFAVLREPTRGELWRAMRGADVIFHNNPCMQFYWPQVLLRKPWVVALRMLITGPDPVPPGPRRLVMAMKYALVERADVVVANSSYTRGHVEGADQVIPNSYRDSVLRVTDPADRQPLDLVFVGRLDPIKGIDLLIGSVADLTAEGRPVSLTIIGEGEARDDLERQAADLGVADRVRLVGLLRDADLAAELNRHGTVVVPSRQAETFGTVALEAAACGCVTVVADHGGLPEAAGPTGPRFTPGDQQELTATLRRLADDPEAYAAYRAAIPGHVARHAEHVMVDAYREVLEQAVSGGSRPGARGTMRRLLRFLRSGRWTASTPSR